MARLPSKAVVREVGLRDGLIREPIRLEPQALQCHWRLELTPDGVALARTLTGA